MLLPRIAIGACFCLCATLGPGHADPPRPLVFIPGILGSKLCDSATHEVLWGDLSSLANFSSLELPIDAEEATRQIETCAVVSSVQILGPWHIHQYDDLLDTLQSAAFEYELGKSLFVFDYDWRLSNEINAARLNSRIVEWIGQNGELDIIAHSMGGMIARLYLDNHGGSARTKHLISLGTPYRGSTKAILTLDEGWGFWKNLAAHGLDGIRTTTLSFPSIYELLPHYPKGNCCFWITSDGKTESFDPSDPDSWKHFRFVPADFQTSPRREWLARTLAQARKIHDQLASPFPPGVKRVAIASNLVATPFKVFIRKDNGNVEGYQSWGGDGTVIDFSAADWSIEDARASTQEHERIFADDSVREVLAWVLRGDREPTAGALANVQQTIRAADGKRVNVRSIAYRIDPAVMAAGQSGILSIDLQGDTDLKEADLSNISARSDTGQYAAWLEQDSSQTDTTATVRFRLEAPNGVGPHAVSIEIPGIAKFTDYVLIVEP